MRYFFHVKSAYKTYKDEVGRRFLDVNNARAHAAVIAAELAIEAQNFEGFAVCLVDAHGKEVARVPILKRTR